MTTPADMKRRLSVLVGRCGGVVPAAMAASVVQSRISDWTNPHKPDLPRLDQALAIEFFAGGEPLLTAAMAEAHGFRLQPIGTDGGAVPEVVAAAGALMAASGGVASTVGAALADGRLDVAEKAALGAQVAATRDECDAVLAALAGARR